MPKTMDEWQGTIDTWASKTFKHDERGIALHLVREAVGLAVAAGWHNEDILASVSVELQKDRSIPKSLEEEAADITILAFALAGYVGFSLEETLVAKHVVNLHRNWGVPDKQGITEHVP